MELMEIFYSIITVFIVGTIFYFIFKNLFSELIKENILKNKDGIFLSVIVLLVFVVYFFLERLHH